MLSQVQQNWSNCQLGIFTAAVADYRPKMVAKEKIKKAEEQISLDLIKNPDVLLWSGQNKKSDQLLVGFALETENPIENAKKKLERKNLDFIVLNSLQDEGAAFGLDTNKISILDKHNNIEGFELKSKREVAQDILDHVLEGMK